MLDSDIERIGFLLAATARAWRTKLDQRLRPLGLSMGKWTTLAHLARGGDKLTQKEIAARVGIEEPTLAGILDRLQEDGWIARKSHTQDRRCKTIHLQERASTVLGKIFQAAQQLRHELLVEIPRSDLETCIRVLAQIRERAEAVSPNGVQPRTEPRKEKVRPLAVEFVMKRKGRRTQKIRKAGTASLAAAICGVLSLSGCSKKNAGAGSLPPRPVFTAKATTEDVPLYLDEIGTTAALEIVEVKAQVTGQIISREFKDGADVKKGDPLFRIDPRPYQAALDQAQGQLAQAKAQLALNELNLKRQLDLRTKNVTAPQELDTARASFAGDEARVKATEAAVAAAQVNLDYCEVRSPIDGRAGLRNVDVGNLVGPGGASLLTIQGLDPIYTDFTVSEPDLPLVRRYLDNPNLKVMTDAEDDSVGARQGDLYFIDNAVQPSAGTVKLRAITPNPDRALWPSQFVRVRLVLDVLKDATLVPGSAVQIGQNGPYVFVVKPDSTLDLRQVKPGQVHGDLTVISEGVRGGETVVVSGQLQLSPGAKVLPKDAGSGGEAGMQRAKAID